MVVWWQIKGGMWWLCLWGRKCSKATERGDWRVCWVKNGGGNQGGQVCRLGRGGCGRSYLFKISKRKNIFMKTNMTGDVYTLRR